MELFLVLLPAIFCLVSFYSFDSLKVYIISHHFKDYWYVTSTHLSYLSLFLQSAFQMSTYSSFISATSYLWYNLSTFLKFTFSVSQLFIDCVMIYFLVFGLRACPTMSCDPWRKSIILKSETLNTWSCVQWYKLPSGPVRFLWMTPDVRISSPSLWGCLFL